MYVLFTALSNHPDVGGCKDVFGEIKDAYHVLIDVDQRAEYDRVLGVRTAADKLYRETQEAANAAATGRGPFGGGGTGHWRRPPPPPGQQQQQEQQQQQQRDRSFRIFRDPPKPDGHVEYKPLRHDVQVPLSRFDIRRPENDPDMR
jgi:DnaJ-class molecular chaperone